MRPGSKKQPRRPKRAGWPGHTAGWPGTPANGPTPTSGACVSGCAGAAATSSASRSTHGLCSGTSQPIGASRSAGVTGVARSSHASCTAGVRGFMSVRTTRANSTPVVAAARRSGHATEDCAVGEWAITRARRSHRNGFHWNARAIGRRSSPGTPEATRTRRRRMRPVGHTGLQHPDGDRSS